MFEYQAAYKHAAKGLQDTPALELSLLSEDLRQMRMENWSLAGINSQQLLMEQDPLVLAPLGARASCAVNSCGRCDVMSTEPTSASVSCCALQWLDDRHSVSQLLEMWWLKHLKEHVYRGRICCEPVMGDCQRCIPFVQIEFSSSITLIASLERP
ncbi:hypothetical protein ERJ75_001700100 [Trypanosoma vivax]|nr:hypothetical protein ERJ75_001700100 [Trypanosoma vivax]